MVHVAKDVQVPSGTADLMLALPENRQRSNTHGRGHVGMESRYAMRDAAASVSAGRAWGGTGARPCRSRTRGRDQSLGFEGENRRH